MGEGRAHLHQGKLLLAGVVVARGTLILLGVVGAVLVGVLVGGMHKLPGVLERSERGETFHAEWETPSFRSDSHDHGQSTNSAAHAGTHNYPHTHTHTFSPTTKNGKTFWPCYWRLRNKLGKMTYMV